MDIREQLSDWPEIRLYIDKKEQPEYLELLTLEKQCPDSVIWNGGVAVQFLQVVAIVEVDGSRCAGHAARPGAAVARPSDRRISVVWNVQHVFTWKW